MRLSIDPKPIGAFIEYTLKPLIDDSRELVDVLDSHKIKLGDIISYAFKLYIIDCIVRLVTNLSVTGMICYTVFYCLNMTK